MKKHVTLFWAAASMAMTVAFAGPYCGVEELPDLIKCLPAPPEPGSAEFARDVARYEWGKEQRRNPERAALARHDAVWSYATIADAFSGPFGMEISPTNTPNIWKVLEDGLSTSDQMRVAPKAFDFVALAEAVPDAILEIRYYSTYNFVGERIDGYDEPCALITKEAAKALKAASDECVKRGYRLKIYDAYRPQRAVAHFVRWAGDIANTRMKAHFYPNLDKSVLFAQGYIAERSGHSRGSTVDLTLFDTRTGKEVDMGGTFDWFGMESHPSYRGITKEQFANRMLLREIMVSHGFKPIEEEWWHFTLRDEPYPDTYFDFTVSFN